MTGHSKEWDARAYHRLSEPQFEWGLKVLARLPLRGDETVLDAGCGSGRLTARLLERLPRGRVLALDASKNMLEQARATLEPLAAGRVEYLHADLGALALEDVADAVFSTATFHWVLDHAALFIGLHRALRPGGLLVAQCGGGQNLERVRRRAQDLMRSPRFAPHFAGWQDAWYYADVASTEARAARAGLTEVKVWLEEAPATFPDAETFAAFLRAVVMRTQLARLPADEQDAFLGALVEAAAKDSPPYTLDYWRLNVDARRR